MGLLGERARADDVVIGSLFAWALGLGVLFLSIFTNGAAPETGRQASASSSARSLASRLRTLASPR